MTQAANKRKVYCPICKKQIQWQDNPHRPFCSERCRLVDLGAWADGSYSVKIIDKPDFEDSQQGQPDPSDPNDQ